MIRRPPRTTLDRSSAASDVYKRQGVDNDADSLIDATDPGCSSTQDNLESDGTTQCQDLSLIHISEPTRPY